MSKILSQLQETGEPCEIYYDLHDNAKFDVGIICDFDDDYVLYFNITAMGEGDGYRVVDRECVFMIQTGTKYLDRDRVLSLQQIDPGWNCTLNFNGVDILHSALEYAMENKKICAMDICFDTELCGRILALDDGLVELAIIDQYGQQDGYAYFDEDDINALAIDSMLERALKNLNRKNK